MDDRRRISFDNKIPLTWLISSAATVLFLLGSVLWNVASQGNKLDQLVIQSDKTERYNIERDAKLDRLIKDGYDIRRNEEIINLRIDSIEKGKIK